MSSSLVTSSTVQNGDKKMTIEFMHIMVILAVLFGLGVIGSLVKDSPKAAFVVVVMLGGIIYWSVTMWG